MNITFFPCGALSCGVLFCVPCGVLSFSYALHEPSLNDDVPFPCGALRVRGVSFLLRPLPVFLMSVR